MRKTILLFFLFFLPLSGQAATQPWTTQEGRLFTDIDFAQQGKNVVGSMRIKIAGRLVGELAKGAR